MNTREGMAVIDFGLGCISHDVEDKGTDVVMMKKALATSSEVERGRSTKMRKALGGKEGQAFASAYTRAGGKMAVLKMAEDIEKRGRYMERG
jgi:tRNA A-37 threonylcarbamoyl transferase component Bud32